MKKPKYEMYSFVIYCLLFYMVFNKIIMNI